jgi:hypothetical protein
MKGIFDSFEMDNRGDKPYQCMLCEVFSSSSSTRQPDAPSGIIEAVCRTERWGVVFGTAVISAASF